MVLICANDLQTRRAGGFFVFRLPFSDARELGWRASKKGL
jgi:hypothetical protein